jgi:hypothetical protein
MMSKYFGEFLVEKGVISQENLVDALVDQIASTPPLCQVIVQKRILTTAKVFEAFRFQQDHQVEFMQACKSIGAWTQEVQDKTFSAIDDIRRPLGHILVSKGLIDLKKLTNMLDEFLSQLAITPTPQAAPIAPTPAPAVEMVKAPEPLKSMIDLSELTDSYQPGILMELEETFDEKKKKMVRVALSLVRDNAGTDTAICKKLMMDVFKIVHSLNGLLGLLALDKLSEILTLMEGHLSQLQPNLGDRSKELIIEDTLNLTKAIELAWGLRCSILANATERVFLSELENQTQFLELSKIFRG